MFFFIISFILELLLLGIANVFFPESDVDVYSWLFVSVNILLVAIYLLFIDKSRYKVLIFLAFMLRIGVMILDYCQILAIPHSGIDSENFHSIALENQYLTEKGRLTNYTDFLTLIYSITNSSRIIAQYINVLLGLGVILIVRQIISIIYVTERHRVIVMSLVAFLPNMLIFSAILLREAWVQFFIAASVLYFVKWFLKRSSIGIIMTITCVLVAAYMHSGALGLLLGYLVAFISYDHSGNKARFSAMTIINLILFAGLSIIASGYMDIFTGKFRGLETEEDFIKTVNYITDGDSAYLMWMDTSSLWQGLLFAPLKMFYFMFSPLPTDWRGTSDVVAFFMDGTIYLWLCITLYWNVKKGISKWYKEMAVYIIISLFVSVFLFSYGTYTSGTAIRHRAKLLPVLLVAFAATTVKSKSKINCLNF